MPIRSYGFYWSSTPNSDYSYRAWHLYFDSSYFPQNDSQSDSARYLGQSVRPLRGFVNSERIELSANSESEEKMTAKTYSCLKCGREATTKNARVGKGNLPLERERRICYTTNICLWDGGGPQKTNKGENDMTSLDKLTTAVCRDWMRSSPMYFFVVTNLDFGEIEQMRKATGA